MDPEYQTLSTSSKTAKVDDIWLERPEDEDAAVTRKVLRAEIVDNVHSDKARVKACVVHQRRHAKDQPWEDVDRFNLATLKAGQEVKLSLSCAATLEVYEALTRIYEISAPGVPSGRHEYQLVEQSQAVVVKGPPRDVLRKLLEGHAGDEVWKALEEIQPHLFKATMLTKLHQVREQAVLKFDELLKVGDGSESVWQKFFEENTWIFGYGLTYRFLSTIQAQPAYGAPDVSGKGGQRGDFLTMTAAEKRFTVLVEIKKPGSPLMDPREYRKGAHAVSGELAGAVAQMQANSRRWEDQGVKQPETADKMTELGAHTVRPKSILIIGQTHQLDNRAKRESFELFRNNLHAPEIITFDELLGRSRHLLLNAEKQIDQASEPEPKPEGDDEIPF